MAKGEGPIATWRTDYPERPPRPDDDPPWHLLDFDRQPELYMGEILDLIRPAFRRSDDKRLVGDGTEAWWITPWMDYTRNGRERRMGLTRERHARKGDLSPTSKNLTQVWAVGFYNQAGAAVVGEVFSDLCDPVVPVRLDLPQHTIGIKFLFTDADPEDVAYLRDAPTYEAIIDPQYADPQKTGLKEREPRDVRLLQVDIAVKDERARETGWVFGTYGWVGPGKGDGLFDNLVPVSLQWGNDPGVYDTSIAESWINPALEGVMYGWTARPTLGFNGRANGPADNMSSSCLSCHAAARTPRASAGLAQGLDPQELGDATAVRRHVDRFFQNQRPQQLFMPDEPAVATLDYSLQIESGLYRICNACLFGDLKGPTPGICRSAGFYNRPTCSEKDATSGVVAGMTALDRDAAAGTRRMDDLMEAVAPRQ